MRLLIEAIEPFAGSLFFYADLHDLAVEHARLKEAVESILGPLDDGGEPHITVLYMGKGHTPADAQSVAAAATPAMTTAVVVEPIRVDLFPPGPSSEGRTPIIVTFRSPELEALHTRILRATVEWNQKNQFLDYRPHMTLGYASRPPNARETDLIRNLPLPFGPFKINAVELTYGKEMVASYLLGSSA